MAVYMVGFATIHDMSKMPEYVRRVHEIVAQHGGEFVYEGRYAQILEGSLEPAGLTPTTSIAIRFDDTAAANRMYDSDEYVALREFRKDAETATIVLVEEFDGPPPEAPAGDAA
jgi:uncharacterized protein (DUF1330 family)